MRENNAKYLTYTYRDANRKECLFLEPLTDEELDIIQCVTEFPEYTGIAYPQFDAQIVDDDLNEVYIYGSFSLRYHNPGGRLTFESFSDVFFPVWKADKERLRAAIDSATWQGELIENLSDLYHALVKEGRIIEESVICERFAEEYAIHGCAQNCPDCPLRK